MKDFAELLFPGEQAPRRSKKGRPSGASRI